MELSGMQQFILLLVITIGVISIIGKLIAKSECDAEREYFKGNPEARIRYKQATNGHKAQSEDEKDDIISQDNSDKGNINTPTDDKDEW